MNATPVQNGGSFSEPAVVQPSPVSHAGLRLCWSVWTRLRARVEDAIWFRSGNSFDLPPALVTLVG